MPVDARLRISVSGFLPRNGRKREEDFSAGLGDWGKEKGSLAQKGKVFGKMRSAAAKEGLRKGFRAILFSANLQKFTEFAESRVLGIALGFRELWKNREGNFL